MLCTRMHLTERRHRLPPISSSTDGPWIRPCSTRDLSNEFITPRTTRNGKNSPEPHPKVPLIIITLNVPAEIQTLAPKSIKRDPKKLPRFCQQYQSITKSLALIDDENILDNTKKYVDSPQFLIQGYEITDPKISNANHDYVDDSIEVSSTNSCEFAMVELFKKINNISSKLVLNLDDYEMDSFGHLPGDSGAPTPVPFPRLNLRRTPSPSTGQIIRVDVKINRNNGKIK